MILGILSDHNSSSSIISEYLYLFIYFFFFAFYALLVYMQHETVIYSSLLQYSFYRNIQNLYTYCRDFFSGDLCPGEKKPVFLFLNLRPPRVTQGLSDNRYFRYFTAVGVFFGHLNATHHQLSDVKHIQVRSRSFMG